MLKKDEKLGTVHTVATTEGGKVMQTYLQYRVCEGPLPSMGILKHFSSDGGGPTCFLISAPANQRSLPVNADDLLYFLETYGDTPEKFQVLVFLSKHPRTRCTLDCLCRTHEARQFDARRAVQELVRQGVLEEAQENDTLYYALTADPEKRASVASLGTLSWDQVRFWNEHRVLELMQAQAAT